VANDNAGADCSEGVWVGGDCVASDCVGPEGTEETEDGPAKAGADAADDPE
jgi:hypothetical protein